MPPTPLQQILLLHRLPDVRDSALHDLLELIEAPANVFDATTEQWRACGLGKPAIDIIKDARDRPGRSAPWQRAVAESERLLKLGANAMTQACEAFPALLQTVREPPPFLYILGDPDTLAACQVAMVGSRRASSVGRRLSRSLAGELVEQGLTVTSGLALGIDGEAHRGALAAGGNTVAVMATGIDVVYPRRHRQLAREICGQGCLVSEFPPGTMARPWSFPRRNRIISGLSLGTVVVEARLPSGSLITAGTALAQGREVMAVPHSAGSPGGAGCHQLLKDGATLVESADDVVQALTGVWCGAVGPGARAAPLPVAAEPERSPCYRAVLDLLGQTVTGLEQLVEDSGHPSAQVLVALTELEVDGRARRTAGGYCRC